MCGLAPDRTCTVRSYEAIVGRSSIDIMVVAEQLPHELAGQHAGKTRVKDVRVDLRDDSSGRPALFIVLVLSAPPKGADTWPIDDLWKLRRMVSDTKARMEAQAEYAAPELPWYVVFESEYEELLDAEDIGEQLDADG